MVKRAAMNKVLSKGTKLNILTLAIVMAILSAVGIFIVFRSRAASIFVTACGTSLCLNGKIWHMYGGSIYGYQSDTASRISLATQGKLNTVRITNMLNESSTDLVNAPFDSTKWAKVDAAIAAAGNANLKVILDLSSYRNLYKNNNRNAYTLDWSTFINWVANRTNTVSGVVYKNDPIIAIISVAGEVDPPNASSATGPTSTQQLTDFYTRTIAQVHAADPNHLVSEGGLLQYGWNSGIDWRSIFALPGDDVPAVHVYSAGDENYAPTIAADATSINKPWMIEEFGFDQTTGDSTRASDFQRVYTLATTNNAAGVAYWNIGTEVLGAGGKTSTYDVNTSTPLTLAAVQANAPATSAKLGDITGDGAVDVRDLAILAAHFRQAGGPAGGDLDNSGLIDLGDYSILALRWGT